MKAEEERCTLDRQLVGLTAKPVYRPLFRANLDEIIADECKYILTGACCVRGDVAELFDRLLDGLNVRHIIRVEPVACSQRRRRVTNSTRWMTPKCERRSFEEWRFGVCRLRNSKVWLGIEPATHVCL